MSQYTQLELHYCAHYSRTRLLSSNCFTFLEMADPTLQNETLHSENGGKEFLALVDDFWAKSLIFPVFTVECLILKGWICHFQKCKTLEIWFTSSWYMIPRVEATETCRENMYGNLVINSSNFKHNELYFFPGWHVNKQERFLKRPAAIICYALKVQNIFFWKS